MINLKTIKDQFPIFKNQTAPLVYLDNASTTHKPQVALDAIENFYAHFNSNVHRGIYTLSELATEKYEKARLKVAQFINTDNPQEIIFTKSTTEAINLVAYTWGEANINADDEILVSIAEHHSNFLPWQQLAKRKRAILKVIPINNNGLITKENVVCQISQRTKLLAINHISNVLGSVTSLNEIIEMAHNNGIKVLVDAAQSIPHLPIDVRKLNSDWLTFSGHKMYGPTGIGVLYGRKDLLETMPPFIFGGGMIKEVLIDRTTWAELPQKFEGGTPPICEAIALGAAIDFIQELGWENIKKHEGDLLNYALEELLGVNEIIIYGPRSDKNHNSIISFNFKDIHSHDIATLVNDKGIALRAGHHCAQPLMQVLGVPATCRISMAVYNSKSDIDALIDAIKYAKDILL